MKMKRIIFFDTETTGIDAQDRLCQIAYKIYPGQHGGASDEIFTDIFKPALPIPPGASAVHHITNEMVKDKPAFTDSPNFRKIKKLFEDENTVLVAHNMSFDDGMIKKEGIELKNTICTLRVARYLDKDAKLAKHNLQFLRYALGIEIEATAHDAMGDVLVLEKLFERLLKKIVSEEKIDEDTAITRMIEISSHPSLMRVFSFGKHNGKKVEEVASIDRPYLEWLLNQKEANDDSENDDWVYTLRHYLNR
jgi:DNA polymerase III epsilon subunit-like protein